MVSPLNNDKDVGDHSLYWFRVDHQQKRVLTLETYPLRRWLHSSLLLHLLEVETVAVAMSNDYHGIHSYSIGYHDDGETTQLCYHNDRVEVLM
jgi:hypothetical protein